MRRFFYLLTCTAFVLGILWIIKIHDGYEKGRIEYQDLTKRYVTGNAAVRVARNEEHMQSEDIEEADDTDSKNRTTEKVGSEKLPAERFALPEDAPKKSSVDLSGLAAINPDVIAWIEIPALEISYPVLQGEDNSYYLHRDIYRDYLFAGSIFMDCLNSPSFVNKNTILYGHNMRDMSMFAKLRNLADPDILASCPYFWIYRKEEDILYRIFSVHTAASGSSTYTIRFGNAMEFETWLSLMQEKSCIKSTVSADAESRIVTLSTCTGDSAVRQVVQGICLCTIKEGLVYPEG